MIQRASSKASSTSLALAIASVALGACAFGCAAEPPTPDEAQTNDAISIGRPRGSCGEAASDLGWIRGSEWVTPATRTDGRITLTVGADGKTASASVTAPFLHLDSHPLRFTSPCLTSEGGPSKIAFEREADPKVTYESVPIRWTLRISRTSAGEPYGSMVAIAEDTESKTTALLHAFSLRLVPR